MFVAGRLMLATPAGAASWRPGDPAWALLRGAGFDDQAIAKLRLPGVIAAA